MDEQYRHIELATFDRVAELELHIQCRLGRQVRDLRLIVVAQGVILRGFASTYYAKQLAQHAVMNAAGLPIAANEIQVA